MDMWGIVTHNVSLVPTFVKIAQLHIVMFKSESKLLSQNNSLNTVTHTLDGVSQGNT